MTPHPPVSLTDGGTGGLETERYMRVIHGILSAWFAACYCVASILDGRDRIL